MKLIVKADPTIKETKCVNLTFVSNDGMVHKMKDVPFYEVRDKIDMMEDLVDERVDTYAHDYQSTGTLNGDIDKTIRSDLHRGEDIIKAIKTGDWNPIFSDKVFKGNFQKYYEDYFDEHGNKGKRLKFRPLLEPVIHDMYDTNTGYYSDPEGYKRTHQELVDAANSYNMDYKDFMAELAAEKDKIEDWNNLSYADKKHKLLETRSIPLRYDYTIDDDGHVIVDLDSRPEYAERAKKAQQTRRLKKQLPESAFRDEVYEPKIQEEFNVIKPGQQEYTKLHPDSPTNSLNLSQSETEEVAAARKQKEKDKAKIKKLAVTLANTLGVDKEEARKVIKRKAKEDNDGRDFERYVDEIVKNNEYNNIVNRMGTTEQIIKTDKPEYEQSRMIKQAIDPKGNRYDTVVNVKSPKATGEKIYSEPTEAAKLKGKAMTSYSSEDIEDEEAAKEEARKREEEKAAKERRNDILKDGGYAHTVIKSPNGKKATIKINRSKSQNEANTEKKAQRERYDSILKGKVIPKEFMDEEGKPLENIKDEFGDYNPDSPELKTEEARNLARTLRMISFGPGYMDDDE